MEVPFSPVVKQDKLARPLVGSSYLVSEPKELFLGASGNHATCFRYDEPSRLLHSTGTERGKRALSVPNAELTIKPGGRAGELMVSSCQLNQSKR